MFIAALFTIAKIGEQPKCTLMDEWIKKIWHTHTHTHTHTHNGILFNHRKENILPFATTWMELESVMLREISQTEKDKYCVVSLICGIYKH